MIERLLKSFYAFFDSRKWYEKMLIMQVVYALALLLLYVLGFYDTHFQEVGDKLADFLP